MSHFFSDKLIHSFWGLIGYDFGFITLSNALLDRVRVPKYHFKAPKMILKRWINLCERRRLNFAERYRVFLKKLEEGLKEHLLAAVLYGSVARGSAGPESDIDLLILYRKGKIDVDQVYVNSALQADKSPEYQRLYKKGLYGEISPLLMTLEEIRKNPLILLDMMEEGIILYQRDNCFTQLVERMRTVTKKLGSRRVNLPDGSWYWELKPSWKPGELIEVSL